MDGISGVVTSNNNYHEVVEKVIGKKSNFLFENIYGYDCTAHSFASLVSGSNPSNYNVLQYRKSK